MLLLGCSGEAPAGAPIVIDDVQVEQHAEVATLLVVTWAQSEAATSWLAWTTADGEEGASPPVERTEGEEVVLGVPGDTDLELRVVAERDGTQAESAPVQARTGSVPQAFLPPVVPTWAPDAASPERWLLGSVDVDGGNAYTGPFWLFLVDREGRVVWYHDLVYAQSMFPRVARDGTHVAFDAHSLFGHDPAQDVVRRRTLDGRYQEEVPTPHLGWSWDETDDGRLYFDQIIEGGTSTLEVVDDGVQSTVWDCMAWLAPLDPDPEHCFTNTVNWTASRESVLWSTYWGDWVAEIDLASREPRWYAGALPGGLAFDPPDAVFDLQHYANFTPDGTLLVSTHVPDVEGTQRAREYEVDEAGGALRQVWSYGEGVEGWARYSGEAVRLANGNLLQNYGTGGEVREVTPDGETVWSLQFGDEHTLGHTQLVGDLYALNTGR